ncbi:MAG: sulfur transferase [Acidobacteria bacterium]|nr:MAG: sulfur transferase [Acidobacteriota bacterium]PYY07215.1 MAG: sulfur transferase [Acidobacteriota bacterium]
MYRTLNRLARPALIFAIVASATFAILLPVQAQCPATPTIFQTSLLETNQPGTEISTERLQQILASGSMRVFDVRFPLEYAISHIAGAMNIPPENNTIVTREVSQITALYPDPHAEFVLTCNGPFCGKSKRVAAALVSAGYDNFYRYQLGLPVWRALGNTVETDLDGFAYIFNGDRTAVFVDARTPEVFRDDTVACAVNIQPGEAAAANEDGRLPLWDKGARVVVFADNPQLAAKVAGEIAKKAYWSSSYFSGTLSDLENSQRVHIHSERRCHTGEQN